MRHPNFRKSQSIYFSWASFRLELEVKSDAQDSRLTSRGELFKYI